MIAGATQLCCLSVSRAEDRVLRRRFEAEREDALEEAYQSYLERQGQRRAAQRVKRARLGKSGDLPEEDAETDGDDEAAAPVPLIQAGPLTISSAILRSNDPLLLIA